MSCGDTDLKCTRCRLSRSRTQVVPGTGPCDARVVFIGEAPGKDEDLKGEPFVGRAGKILDAALVEAGVRRDQVYIVNLVKCRPPGNRRPRKDEVSACSRFLESELRQISPVAVCALGQTVASELCGTRDKMSALAGRAIDCSLFGMEVRLFVNYHPAACLYQRKNLAKFKKGIKASLSAAGF